MDTEYDSHGATSNQTAQMDLVILGIALHDQKRITCIRLQIGVNDNIGVIKKIKRRWWGPVTRLGYNRWTTVVT